MDICSLGFALTPALERHVREKLTAALEVGAGAVNGVMVRLRDINGVRGGVDKACRIVVWLRRGGTVVVEAVDRDLYTAVESGGLRLKEALTRRIKRRRTLQRGHALRPRSVVRRSDARSRASSWRRRKPPRARGASRPDLSAHAVGGSGDRR